jgi:hypothetical protein
MEAAETGHPKIRPVPIRLAGAATGLGYPRVPGHWGCRAFRVPAVVRGTPMFEVNPVGEPVEMV